MCQRQMQNPEAILLDWKVKVYHSLTGFANGGHDAK